MQRRFSSYIWLTIINAGNSKVVAATDDKAAIACLNIPIWQYCARRKIGTSIFIPFNQADLIAVSGWVDTQSLFVANP
ncbi:hypothetical protein AMR42_15590 [Limnothrix sp. PR1529]|nr:hypothetical protein BCR12_18635 [Limnothrix sp. P13C2]PIB05630.1 hypothetical protein AMR42_15590 [Limnothrix sp. PR1529]